MIKNFYSVVFYYFQTSFTQLIEEKISLMIMKKYSFQRFDFYVNNSSSKLLSKIHNDVITVSRNYTGALITVFSEFVIVLGFLSIIILFKLFDIVIIFITFASFGLIMLKILSFFSKKWGKLTKEENIKKISSINSLLTNIKNVIIDNKFKVITSEFNEIVKKLASYQKKVIASGILPRNFFEIFGVFSIAAIILYLLSKNASNQQIIIVTGFFVTISYRLIPSFQKIISGYQALSYSKSMLYTVLEQLELQEQVSHSDSKIDFSESIKLKNLYFSYPDRNKEIFNSINFKINKNELIGIFGSSGVGKSTLIEIIAGLKKPTGGKLFVDNLEISSAENIRKWQNNISYVSQNPILIKDSLKNNIIYSKKDEIFDEKLFYDTLEKSELLNLAESLPKKIDTDLGEFGSKLSGGQKQRVCIARAIYKQPQFIIFDEATNALDLENEAKILKTIHNLRNEMTIVIISHKREIISRCEKIFEIKNKKINQLKKL